MVKSECDRLDVAFISVAPVVRAAAPEFKSRITARKLGAACARAPATVIWPSGVSRMVMARAGVCGWSRSFTSSL